MSKLIYLELVDALCRLCACPQPGAIAEGGALHVEGVAFSLLHDPRIDDALAFIYADFGALPRGRELPAAMALLEANLFLYGGAGPAFAVSPGTERVTMAHHCVLAETDAGELHGLLVNIAGKARQWREDHFLDPATNPFQLQGQHAAMTLAR